MLLTRPDRYERAASGPEDWIWGPDPKQRGIWFVWVVQQRLNRWRPKAGEPKRTATMHHAHSRSPPPAGDPGGWAEEAAGGCADAD